ncbi:MAG: hypothetical protein OXC10_05975 [Rhodospirillaceae bacterium]|nr:hypothetical protein [Rhodospirillaceae bacterium]
MTDRNPPALEDVFHALDRWRHLPGYRLEPNLAPFFGLYLPDILRECLKTKPVTHPTILPEFPLRLGTLYEDLKKERPHSRENQSVQVDYAAFSSDLKNVYFVELKTDEGSINKEQLNYLRFARNVGFRAILDGILDICRATDHVGKYIHLIHNLEKLGMISILDSGRDRLYEKTFPKGKSGWRETLNCVSSAASEKTPLKIEIVYITPTGSSKKVREADFCEIGFDCVADIVESRGYLGLLFANYLRKWTSTAGKMDPRKFRSAP